MLYYIYIHIHDYKCLLEIVSGGESWLRMTQNLALPRDHSSNNNCWFGNPSILP